MTHASTPIRTIRAAVAAVAAAFLVVATNPAEAVPAKPVPESFKFKAGTALVKDNTSKEIGGPEGSVVIGPQNNLVMRGVNTRNGKRGLVVTKTLDLFVQGIPDPRSATLPATYTAGAGVGGTYQVITRSDANPDGTTTTWTVDTLGAAKFVMKVKKFDTVTNRMIGTFSGTLKGTELGQRNLKITAGTFVIDMTVLDPMEPTKR